MYYADLWSWRETYNSLQAAPVAVSNFGVFGAFELTDTFCFFFAFLRLVNLTGKYHSK